MYLTTEIGKITDFAIWIRLVFISKTFEDADINDVNGDGLKRQ